MITYDFLISSHIATAKKINNDMDKVIRMPDDFGDVPGEHGLKFFEGKTDYGKMRIEATIEPGIDNNCIYVQNVFMIYILGSRN